MCSTTWVPARVVRTAESCDQVSSDSPGISGRCNTTSCSPCTPPCACRQAVAGRSPLAASCASNTRMTGKVAGTTIPAITAAVSSPVAAAYAEIRCGSSRPGNGPCRVAEVITCARRGPTPRSCCAGCPRRDRARRGDFPPAGDTARRGPEAVGGGVMALGTVVPGPPHRAHRPPPRDRASPLRMPGCTDRRRTGQRRPSCRFPVCPPSCAGHRRTRERSRTGGVSTSRSRVGRRRSVECRSPRRRPEPRRESAGGAGGFVQPEGGASLGSSELGESDLTIIANGDVPFELGTRYCDRHAESVARPQSLTGPGCTRRAGSTTHTAGSAGSPPASPPTPPDARAR